MALTKMNTDLNIIAALDNEPNSVGGLSAAELKAKFDESGNAIKTYINETLTAETDAHIVNTDNPHTVTAAQVGLGNCDNTADIDKPVSTPQQEALNLKANSDNVLEKNNVAEYNPTANYHPATKKYVDDTVGQAVLGSIPDGAITEVKLDASLTEKINNAAPELHASQHAIGGSDPLTPADIGAAENLLPDDVASALGLTGNPQVSDALAKIKTLIDGNTTLANSKAKIATGSYTGTGTYGSGNPNTLVLDLNPKLIIITSTQYNTRPHVAILLFEGSVSDNYRALGTLLEPNSTSSIRGLYTKRNVGFSVSWYHKESAADQMNSGDFEYVAIG